MSMAAASKQEDEESMDRISMLPYDILGRILSHLSFKEATATSILSRRWRNSWTFTRKLDFNGGETLDRLSKNLKKKGRSELDKERVNYLRWVNNVIALCNDISVEEFKVHFNLDRTHQACIDEWVRFALSKSLETFVLSLTNAGCRGVRKCDECYTFPHNLVGQYELVKLRRVCMDGVNVSGEAVELFLQNCPVLEELSVSGSGHLLDLRIIGPYSSLKRLEIRACFNIRSVEIRGLDIEYLKYIGRSVDFVLENLPRLVNLDIGGRLSDSMGDVLDIFSSYLPQLVVFTFDKIGPLTLEDTQLLYSMVRMSNLEQLRVAVFIRDDEGDDESDLLPLSHLLRAAPRLQSFVVKATRCRPTFASISGKKMWRRVLWSKLEKASPLYPRLKEVKFLNYSGAEGDLDLIEHFLWHSEAVEDIVVCTRLASDWDTSSMWDAPLSTQEMNKRKRVEKQLQILSPPSRIKLSVF